MNTAGKFLIFIAGIAAGCFASRGYSYQKAAEAVATLPAAAAKMDVHAEVDVAFLVRAMRASRKGLDPNEDQALLRNLADFYHSRRKLTEEERRALGSDPVLKGIEELSAENPALKSALDSGS